MRAMKKVDSKGKSSGFFRGMFDNIRSTVPREGSKGSKSEYEVEETLKPDQFQVTQIVRHGFPHQPTAVAFDPVQRLIAIGTKTGSLRILGRPGVDIQVQHIPAYAVMQIIFMVNNGQLLSVCADDSIHLWSLTAKPPEVIHTIKFQKERITYCHLTFQSKWLYVGTERGNVHVVNVDTLQLSGYLINWNKAIDLSRKTHPGSIVHLSDCPIDSNKLLLGYESGCIVLWDLRSKSADWRIYYHESMKSISWHHDGRQFIASHTDGSVTTWSVRGGQKPVAAIWPHSKAPSDMKPEPCRPIYKAEWRTVRTGEPYIVFSGGLPVHNSGNSGGGGSAAAKSAAAAAADSSNSKTNGSQSLTVIHGKATTVLEMEDTIIDFITLCESAYESDFNDPYAIVVLLCNDLVVVDLLSPGYPCFHNPYSMDIHESPVTYCYYLADCPTDLVYAFLTVGRKTNKPSGFSDKEWPINGGEWGNSTVSYPELIITGHADGSLKFWDASSVHLHQLYKLKTSKLFEKPKVVNKSAGDLSAGAESGVGLQENDDPFAIEQLTFCTDTKYLCIAGASSQVIGFRFSKHETHTEIPMIEVPMNYEDSLSGDGGADNEVACGASALLTQSSNDSHDTCGANSYLLRVKSGHHKRAPGFQAEFVCLSPWIDSQTPPFRITSLCVNSYANLIAYGTENSLIIIDTIQKSAVLNVSTSNLYGAADPYQRTARSMKNRSTAGAGGQQQSNRDTFDGNQSDADRTRSPTSDQYEDSRSLAADQSVPNTPVSPTPPPPPTPTDPTFSMCSVIPPIPPPRLKRKTTTTTTTTTSSSSNVSSSDTTSVKSVQSCDEVTEHTLMEEKEEVTDEGDRDNTNNMADTDAAVNCQQLLTDSITAEAIVEINSGDQTISFAKVGETSPTTPPVQTSDGQPSESSSSPPTTISQRPKDLNLDSIRKTSKTDECLVSKNFSQPTSPSADDSDTTSTTTPVSSAMASELSSPVSDTNCDQQKQHMRSAKLSQIKVNNNSSGSTAAADAKQQRAAAPVSHHHLHHYLHKSKHKIKVYDMRHEDCDESLVSRLINKIDSSFSRSRSSSISSLENITIESILYMAFAETYCNKSDLTTSPCLWVGTSLGSVLVISLTLPDSADNRILCLQTVIAVPSGGIYRLKGSILCISFLDFTGAVQQLNADAWRDSSSTKPGNTTPGSTASSDSKRNPGGGGGSLSITRTGSSSGGPGTPTGIGGSGGSSSGRNNKVSPTSSSTDMRDPQFVVMVSEKQIRLVTLPQQTCAYKATLTETSFAVRADVVYMRSADSICLAVYLGTGNIVVYSLPSLRLLIDIDFLALTDVRIARTICFSANGHGMYMSSPSTLTKFTILSSFRSLVADMTGTLFTAAKELPEPPKPTFLKSLFGGGSGTLDREELFGETNSGKPSKTTARHIPGAAAGTEQLRQQANVSSNEMARLREVLSERGEKVAQLEDKTAAMRSDAEAFGSAAHQVMLKYRDKKWYQF